MTDNGPNTAFGSQEALIDRARIAGKIVSPFFQGDLDKLHEAVKRLGSEETQRPERLEYHPVQMVGSTIFPHLDSHGEASLTLQYPDLAEIAVRHSVAEYDEPFNDTAIREFDRSTDHSLHYSTPSGSLTVKMSADFKGSFTFEGFAMQDAELTEEAVVLYEDLADRIRPILAEVPVSA